MPAKTKLLSRYGPKPSAMAARIKAERNRIGLSQEEAAAKLGIARNTYKNLEYEANPQLSTLVGLVTELGMDPRALVPELTGRK